MTLVMVLGLWTCLAVGAQPGRNCAGHVYRNGHLERVDNAYGYRAADSTCHYHIADYQGNIRAVVASDGTLEEADNYYPYGGLLGAATAGVQPLKYGAKELDRENGLDLYDSRARWYDPLLGRTTTQDPLAEKYPHLSPYLWCAGNPIKLIDKDGKNYGDTLATQDAAAIDFGICYNGKSIIKNLEYVTNIYSFKISNGMTAYSYTIPQLGTSMAGTNPIEPAYEHPIVARAHTHAAFLKDFNNNKFSGETNSAEGNKHSSGGDIFLYNLKEVDGYVATPNGSLRKYDYKTGEVMIISEQMPSDKNDPKRLNNISPVLSILATFFNLKF